MKGKARVPNLSHEQIRQSLDYNPATGMFVWKISPAKNVKSGSRAGGPRGARGYRYIRLNEIDVTEHRLAWFYMNGSWPDRRIKVKNGDISDCRFENLTVSNGPPGNDDLYESKAAYLKAHRSANPKFWRETHLQYRFNLSLDDYTKMFEAQEGKCAICLQSETHKRNGKLKALAVDHDHTTGQIRGLLCADCNTGIGKLKEDLGVLKNAIKYLELHSSRENAELVTSERSP